MTSANGKGFKHLTTAQVKREDFDTTDSETRQQFKEINKFLKRVQSCQIHNKDVLIFAKKEYTN